jgi:carbamate kinase
MRLVIALGGNALLRSGEPPDAETQRRNIDSAAQAIAPIIRSHEAVITHGNGPQVGLLALQAAAYRDVPPYPLDLLGAESEGLIGGMLELALANVLPEREIATLLTLVEVDLSDGAFAAPQKPIGPLYPEAEAKRLANKMGWPMQRDGSFWRRVVPSPTPRRIREAAAIGLLMQAGFVVICAGGGGIPIVFDDAGACRGVEAVIDKDYAAALLAETIEAECLLLLTDVPGVWSSWPPPVEQQPIRAATPKQLRQLRFAEGSIAPKVEAACRFVEHTGKFAAIGAIADAVEVLAGNSGTIVRRE